MILENEEFIPKLSKVDNIKLKVDKRYILCNENIEEYQVNLSCIIKDQYDDIVNKLPIYSTSLGVVNENVLLLPKRQEYTEVIIQAELDGISSEIKVYMKPAIDIIPYMPTDIEILQKEIFLLKEENLNLLLASAESYETMYNEDTQLMLAMAEMYETIMGGM